MTNSHSCRTKNENIHKSRNGKIKKTFFEIL